MVGGYWANSIAIMSDAAHLTSDALGIGISIVALKIAERGADNQYTFGYHRAEVLGALVSILFIWGITIYLIVEATKRILAPPEINGEIMLIVSGMCLVFNLIQMSILHSKDMHDFAHAPGQGCSGHDHDHDHNHDHHDHSHGDHDHSHDHHHHDHDHKHDEETPKDDKEATPKAEKKKSKPKRNLNVEAAYLHILGDVINSVGVLIASLMIYFTDGRWWIADPICTYIFAILVFYTTRITFVYCIRMLMETAPNDFEF